MCSAFGFFLGSLRMSLELEESSCDSAPANDIWKRRKLFAGKRCHDVTHCDGLFSRNCPLRECKRHKRPMFRSSNRTIWICGCNCDIRLPWHCCWINENRSKILDDEVNGLTAASVLGFIMASVWASFLHAYNDIDVFPSINLLQLSPY